MKRYALCCVLALGIGFAETGHAADFSDPTWPCIQRKVENLSLGIMWPHPVSDAELGANDLELIEALVLRRVSLDDAGELIDGYVAGESKMTTQKLGAVFSEAFERINQRRRAIIEGIGRYSKKQIALAKSIDETRKQMATLMQATDPDFDAVDRLEEKLDWDERIYRDRARSLTYVCETPVQLEKRIYGIGQLLLKHAS